MRVRKDAVTKIKRMKKGSDERPNRSYERMGRKKKSEEKKMRREQNGREETQQVGSGKR